MEDLAVKLFEINAVKFGSFKIKVGLPSPIYFDLRVIISYPELLGTLAELMAKKMEGIRCNQVCGVPYTALPVATLISAKTGIPMVMRRKEAKSYGTKKLIEGVFNVGDICLIIEDVVSSGGSILETVNDLRASGVKCTDAIVLLNREQGGQAILEKNGIKMHALLSMSGLIGILVNKGLIDENTSLNVLDYISSTKIQDAFASSIQIDRLKLPLLGRIGFAKNQMAKNLLSIMCKKETNLCIAADLTHSKDLISLAEEVGPHICCFKTHIDIVEDYSFNLIERLQEIAKFHEFVIMEDRKFGDIGNTVKAQYGKGIFKVSTWADLVTVHSVFGKHALEAIKDSSVNKGVFLIAEASSAGCLIDNKYTEATIKMGEEYEKIVAGFVCQSPLFKDHPGFIQLTPGVQLDESKDNLGQQYNTPEKVVIEKGCDIAVVGRGITKCPNRAKAAKKYQQLLWTAFQKRIK